MLTGVIRPTLRAPGAFRTTYGWVLHGPYRPALSRNIHVRFAPGTVFHTRESNPSPQRSSVPPLVRDAVALIPAPSAADTRECVTHTSANPYSASESVAPTIALPVVLDPIPRDADEDLACLVRRFWEVDKVPERLPLTPEERICEDLYLRDTYRLANGRYVVPLPLRAPHLGASRNVATRQFLRLEKRFARDSELRHAYHDVMQDYLDSGHMDLVSASDTPPSYEPFYIPHHAVHRPDDPPNKLRVVFNASCASANGHSLNDLLFTGPKLQADIATLLLRFRLHRVVFTADIRQMYRQIRVLPAHRDYQRIIWRFSPDEPLQTYRLNTVTFGVSSAPYLALRTIRQLALDEGDKYPHAKLALQEEVYVDDILTGADSEVTAKHLMEQVRRLLMAGGFELRKWATNCPSLLRSLPPEHCRQPTSEDPLQLDRDPVLKILGLGWDPTTDSFFYAVRMAEPASTKRAILSQMARIFDPLGWLTPVVFKAKLFFRQLCRLQLDWDQQLPTELVAPWLEFQQRLPELGHIRLPRLLPTSGAAYTHRLVGFCDASENGYAAVVYLHTTTPRGECQVHQVAAKSKVAPNKTMSLPRLELCGAHLLAKLLHSIASSMLPQLGAYLIAFSDSTVTLAWIRGESHRWKTFVGHRVADIQELIPANAWRHVVSEDNPADCASRGVQPHQLQPHPLWWTGPPWLAETLDNWPTSNDPVPSGLVQQEERADPPLTLVLPAQEEPFFTRYSSLLRLKRVTAYCLRFLFNCRNSATPRQGWLSTSELRSAFIALVRLSQAHAFPVEMKEAQDPQSRHRLVRQLNLFTDKDGILRVGGRLSASTLPYGFRHPLLLPKDHHLTRLIVDDAHLRLLHAGALATHSYLRRQYWIVNGRNVVRHRLAKCNRCFSVKPRPVIQPLGNLPAERISAASAFTVTGVDYAGPFAVSSARLRGAATTKGYLVAFICFATKAVHFEIASELSTSAFLAAFRRFTARRGLPTTVFSDNGTNFVGAHHQLRDLGRLIRNPRHQQLFVDSASTRGIEWRFIPPASPHFGGLWEAAVKSAKHHLSRVIGKQTLTYEELLTVVTEVEAILNSRPLCALSSDSADPEPLTPGHFLIFRPLTAPPERRLTHLALNRLSRWTLTQRIQQDFWTRWSQEYLHTLQQREKWLLPATAISPGTVVILREDNAPPRQWPLGRITALHPGRDGVCRVADVTTASGTFRRPLNKLCPLPSQ
ncbi:uncharacterized protein [Rhodnius prolixus]